MSDTQQTDMRGWPTEETSAAAADAAEQAQASGSEAVGPQTDGKLTGVELEADGMPSPEDCRMALKAVMDPEIGINIVDLGLVYDIAKSPEEQKVVVEMTLTSMGCPLTELIHQQCTLVLTRLPGVEHVDVNFVFSPPWSTEMISDEAQDELRAMGFNV
jgi:metal-sulfur cluster biosynthetic enzyme